MATQGGPERLLPLLVTLPEEEIKELDEETVDQLYVFLLTNKLNPTSKAMKDPNILGKFMSNQQLILRMKNREFQEQLNVYEQEQEKLTEERDELEQLVEEQREKISELEEDNIAAKGGGGREVTVLREEVSALRTELDEANRKLETQKNETHRLTRQLSAENVQMQTLQTEITQKNNEIIEYKHQMEKQKEGTKSSGLVEVELRERLRTQEKEMAEQLDKMEDLLREKQALEANMMKVTEKISVLEEENSNKDKDMEKHQSALAEASQANSELERAIQATKSQLAHTEDQLVAQTDANQKLCERMKEESERAKSKLASCTDNLTQAHDKISQLETQLQQYETSSKKGSVVRLTKELSEKEIELHQLQKNLTQASDDINSLTSQLHDALKRADPEQVNPALRKEISDLQTKCTELEKQISTEQQRRQQSEAVKEECDSQLIEMRKKVEQYERGQVGLKEAITEIKQKKEELTKKDSELSSLIQQVNKLQSQSDTLYEINEALRLRLGMAPDEDPDLTEVRERHHAELNRLRELSQSLEQRVETLEKEKLDLRKKVVDQATSTVSSKSEIGSIRSSSSPDHVTLADLRGQISQLQAALTTERQRKVACQKEIARLSKEVMNSASEKHKPATTKLKIGTEETDSSTDPVTDQLMKENTDLQHQLSLLSQQYQQLLIAVKKKDTELLTVKRLLQQQQQQSVSSTPYQSTPSHTVPLLSTIIPSGASVHSKEDGLNDQLLLVLRELQRREHDLKDCQEQLKQFKRKFSVMIHQQGVLYNEYQLMTVRWKEEKEKLTKEKDDLIAIQQLNQIKLDELKSLQDVLSTDPDGLRQKLGDLSRAVTLLRVNERTISRHNSLLRSSEARLRMEMSQLKQDQSDMSNSFNQQITYLRRYKEAASHKITSLQKQLTQCVQQSQLKEANAQYTTLAAQYHRLFQHQLASVEQDSDTEKRLLAMSERLVQCQASENELRLKLSECGDESRCYQLEDQLSVLELARARLCQENSQLRENLEVIKEQLRTTQHRREIGEKEIQLLRQQMTELASNSDQKTLIGQLQQQILALQLRESQSQTQLKSAKSKVLALEAQLFQNTQQSEEREEEINRARAQYTDRIQQLTTLVQSLIRKYTGATLLPDQVKFSLYLSRAQRNKRESESQLEVAERERETIELKLQELETEKFNLQELMSSLKVQGRDDTTGSSKVTEWQSRLGEMRLKELNYQSTIAKLERNLKHSQERVTSCEETITELEHKIINITKEYEEILLTCEEGGVSRRTNTEPPVKEVVREEPKTKRSSIEPIREIVREERIVEVIECDHLQTITQLQSELQSTCQKCNNLDLSLRKSENLLLEKDRVINELQLQLSSLERQREMEKRNRDMHSSHALQVATETVEQLQAQLIQKEGQVEKYQQLLQENRQGTQMSLETYKEEIKLLEKKLQTQSNAMARLQASAQPAPPTSHPASSISTEQLARLNHLNKLTLDLQETNRTLSNRLETEKREREEEQSRLLKKEEGLRREISQIKQKHRLDTKELQAIIATKSGQVTELEQELQVVNGELSAALEASKKASSRGLRDLVDRLSSQLTSKEHELQVLSESLKQVRADLVDTAQKTLQSHSRQEANDASIHKLIMERVRAVEEKDEEKMKVMRLKILQLETQLEDMKEKWEKSCVECEQLQIDYEKKEKDYQERGTLLERLEGENRNLKKSLTETKAREQKVQREFTQLRERIPSTAKELETLRRRCDILQSKLDKQTEEQSIKASQEKTPPTQPKHESASRLDTKHTCLEVTRWEENKKLQHRVETLRGKLAEKTKEIETLQKYNTSLKEMLARSDREKDVMQEKLRATEKPKVSSPDSVPKGALKGEVSNEEIFGYKSQIFELQNKVAMLEQQLQESSNTELEYLKAQIKTLMDANQTLQKQRKGQVDGDSSSYDSLANESKLRGELLQCKKAHTRLQFQFDQATLEIPRLKSRIHDLEQYVELLRDVSGNSRHTTVIKHGIYTAGEVERTVSAMKKVIERLQAENESLKAKAKKQQRGILESENRRLKAELERVQKSLAALGGERSEDSGAAKSKVSLAGVIMENERLRNELRKEVERNEKLNVSVLKLRADKVKLEEDLSKFSDPHEVLVRDRDKLQKENVKLKSELDSFDPQFFEEIEDLKYNYQVSVQKNIEYEEQLRHYSRQYGFPLPNLENDAE